MPRVSIGVHCHPASLATSCGRCPLRCRVFDTTRWQTELLYLPPEWRSSQVCARLLGGQLICHGLVARAGYASVDIHAASGIACGIYQEPQVPQGCIVTGYQSHSQVDKFCRHQLKHIAQEDRACADTVAWPGEACGYGLWRYLQVSGRYDPCCTCAIRD